MSLSAWKAGLLGGLQGLAQGEYQQSMQDRDQQYKKELIDMQQEGRSEIAQARSQYAQKLKELELDANNRTATYETTGDDGKTYKVTTRRVLNHETGQPEDQELGRAVITAKAKAPEIRTFTEGDNSVTKQWDADKQEWKTVSAGPRFKASAEGGGKLIRRVMPDGTAVYGKIGADNQFTPTTDENGDPLTGQAWRPRNQPRTKAGEADDKGPGYDPKGDRTPVFVDPTKPRSGERADEAASPKTSSGFQEGQTIRDKKGNLYTIRNGRPVPFAPAVTQAAPSMMSAAPDEQNEPNYGD